MSEVNPFRTQLDTQQIFERSFNADIDRIRVDAAITAPLSVDGELLVDIRAADGDSALIVGTEDATLTGIQHVVKVNADGSLNVNAIVTPSAPRTVESLFGSITSVPSGSLTTILTYTVPVSETDYLGKIEVSGTNIGQYDVYINAVLKARQRTYFGGDLNSLFDYTMGQEDGVILNSGDIVEIKVIHNRPMLGDFEARILYAK